CAGTGRFGWPFRRTLPTTPKEGDLRTWANLELYNVITRPSLHLERSLQLRCFGADTTRGVTDEDSDGGDDDDDDGDDDDGNHDDDGDDDGDDDDDNHDDDDDDDDGDGDDVHDDGDDDNDDEEEV
ncbi:hypothetical protein ElyMa_000428700, partial [Elysia marginata]